MKRILTLELVLSDDAAGAMLEVLNALNEHLETMQQDKVLVDYGFRLEGCNGRIVNLDKDQEE